MTIEPIAVWSSFLASPQAPKTAMSPLELGGFLTGVIVTLLGGCLRNRGFLLAAWRGIGFCLLMSKRYRPWKIDEPMVLPATVQEFVDKDHLARFVLNFVVKEIDLEEIERV